VLLQVAVRDIGQLTDLLPPPASLSRSQVPPPPVRLAPDLVALAVSAAGLAVLCGVTMAAQTRLLRYRDVPGPLQIGAGGAGQGFAHTVTKCAN
jgi:hypothetical protein